MKARTKVGIIIPVVSVIPCPVDAELNCVGTKSNVQKPDAVEKVYLSENQEDTVEEEWLSKIDLDHLSVSRRKKVKEVFSKDSSDIGEIKGLKMNINLKDSEPVRKSYTSIPKPLYKEVKDYIEDLLARGWVQRSFSSYCSPIVCVRKKSVQRPSIDKIVWLQQHQDIVEGLVKLLKEPPVMAYPAFSLPFVLHCDASETGLGAVLYQEQESTLRVVSYASRTLTAAEKNYYLHSGKLEFLAMKWSLIEKFNDFLYYAPVYSDCNPLSYVLSSAKLNATKIRWVGELANHNFNVNYRPGKQSTDCDYLSRNPVDLSGMMKQCHEEITTDTIGAVVAGSKQGGKFIVLNY